MAAERLALALVLAVLLAGGIAPSAALFVPGVHPSNFVAGETYEPLRALAARGAGCAAVEGGASNRPPPPPCPLPQHPCQGRPPDLPHQRAHLPGQQAATAAAAPYSTSPRPALERRTPPDTALPAGLLAALAALRPASVPAPQAPAPRARQPGRAAQRRPAVRLAAVNAAKQQTCSAAEQQASGRRTSPLCGRHDLHLWAAQLRTAHR